MTHSDRGQYGKKHPPDRKVDPKIAQAVKDKTSEGTITCAAAFTIVNDLKAPPDEVGFTIDFLEIRIIKCQLGLYGYHPHKKILPPADAVPPDLEKVLGEALVNERLPCAASWEIAAKYGLSKMDVSSACEYLKIKISPCQLGAF